MKLRTFRISPSRAALGGLLCLFLGVVTTVGVAWGLALWSPVLRVGWIPIESDWPRSVPPDWPLPSISGSNYSIGYSHIAFSAVDQDNKTDDWVFIQRLHRFGLPVRATEFEVRLIRDDASGAIRGSVIGAVGVSSQVTKSKPERALPIRVLFPGFIINTVFYGVIWFGLFIAIAST